MQHRCWREGREELDYQPGEVVVRKHYFEELACQKTACDGMARSTGPHQLVPRGKLGVNLVAHALLAKWLDHVPIERQARAWQQQGLPITPRTLGGHVNAAIDQLTLLAERIARRTRASAALTTDSTSCPMLDREHPEGLRLGALWVVTGDQRWVTFRFSVDGSGDVLRAYLGERAPGALQGDGTNRFVFLEKLGWTVHGCLAHGRRRFVHAARLGEQDAVVALNTLGRLFAIESELRAQKADVASRQQVRREKSVPLFAQFERWAAQREGEHEPKSPMAKALGYLRRQSRRLESLLKDGRFELTNNFAERLLRMLVQGRKNWLFVDKKVGGERCARVLSVLATCMAQGVNPRAYLEEVLKRILEGHPRERLAELLPDALVREKPELLLPPELRWTAPPEGLVGGPLALPQP